MISNQRYQELADAINDPDIGGFSADPRRGGKPPKNKYMVGQRDVEEGVHDLPSTGTAIQAYADANVATLSQTDRHLGGWNAGKGYLDIPKGFDRTPEGEVAARLSTMENTQIAYGNVNTSGNYVGDRFNPFHPSTEVRENSQGVDTRTDYSAPKEAEQQTLWAEMPLHSAQFAKKTKAASRKPRPNQTASESFS